MLDCASPLVVEAPGYCPPGPKCLFHLTIYRHSRRTGRTCLGILDVNLKRCADIAVGANLLQGEYKPMKIIAFVTIGAAAMALVACNKNNPDAVQNAELNQPESDLNELANQAAMDAANAQAAADNAQQAANELNAAAANTISPKEADEQNVSGM